MLKNTDKAVLKIFVITFFLNLLVSFLKLIYGLQTKSLSLEADGYHSLVDASANIVGIIGIILASKPPDEDHPYGHRKIESLAALFIAFLLFQTCYEIASSVYDRIYNPLTPTVNWLSYGIMGFTMGVNYFVAHYEKRKAKELKNEVLLADAVHTESDLLVSTSVIVALIASQFKVPFVDLIIASLIVLYIIKVAIEILVGSLNILLDRQLIEPEKIESVLKTFDEIDECHKIRSRGTQGYIFIDLHIHVNPLMTTEASHRLAHDVDEKLKTEIPEIIDVMVHVEPTFLTNPEKYKTKESDH